jgi:hypothetical protein
MATQIEFATEHPVIHGRRVISSSVNNLERTSYKFDVIIHLNGPELGNAAVQARTNEAFSDAAIGVPIVVAPVAVFSAPRNVRQRIGEEPAQYSYIGAPERLDMNDADHGPEPPARNYVQPPAPAPPEPAQEPPVRNYRSIGQPPPNSVSNPIMIE